MTLHIVHVLFGFSYGGIEKGIVTVARGASPGFRHSIVSLSGGAGFRSLLPEGSGFVGMDKKPGNSLRFLRKLSRTLKRLKPDIVHTRNWAGMDAVVAARLAGLKGVVHGEHGWGVDDLEGGSRKRRLARRFLQRWVREFTCVSEDIASWLRDGVGVRQPITQIYNGVDIERCQPGDGSAVRRELEIPADAFLAGIVSRLDPIKDHPTLFRAIEIARGTGRDIRLLVVGDGFDEESLRLLGGEGVHFLGHREDVPDVLRALDCYTLTSLNEGISNTILEAMATGLPVLATRVGGNPELVDEGKTGRLFEAGDADALAEALAAYADDRSLAKSHGAAGRATTVSKYSIPAMVSAYEAVWKRVAGAVSNR